MNHRLPLMGKMKWLLATLSAAFIFFWASLIIFISVAGIRHPWPYPLH